MCGTPPPRHSSQWLNGRVQLYLFLSSVRRGLRRCLSVLRRCYVYIEKFTLRTKIFCLEGWDPRFSFVSCGNKKEGHGEAFLPNHRKIKGPGKRNVSWMRKSESLWAQKGAFSLLMVALPQLWLGNGETGGERAPCVGLCCSDCRHVLGTPCPTDARGQQESLPPASGDCPCWPPSRWLGGSEHHGGGDEIAKNSHGLWDLLFSRNQWN